MEKTLASPIFMFLMSFLNNSISGIPFFENSREVITTLFCIVLC
jgi:hypothetical protein